MWNYSIYATPLQNQEHRGLSQWALECRVHLHMFIYGGWVVSNCHWNAKENGSYAEHPNKMNPSLSCPLCTWPQSSHSSPPPDSKGWGCLQCLLLMFAPLAFSYLKKSVWRTIPQNGQNVSLFNVQQYPPSCTAHRRGLLIPGTPAHWRDTSMLPAKSFNFTVTMSKCTSASSLRPTFLHWDYSCTNSDTSHPSFVSTSLCHLWQMLRSLIGLISHFATHNDRLQAGHPQCNRLPWKQKW